MKTELLVLVFNIVCWLLFAGLNKNYQFTFLWVKPTARFLGKLQGGAEPDMEMHLLAALGDKDLKYMPRDNASPKDLLKSLFQFSSILMTLCAIF